MLDMLDDPAEMTPAQRHTEIAAILARGMLRLRQCRGNSRNMDSSQNREKAVKSGRNCLAEGAKSSPYVSVG